MIDLLADGAPERQFKLLFWDGKKAKVDYTLDLTWLDGSEKRVFRPGKVDPSILRAIHFPSHVASYGTTQELFESLLEVIKRFSGLEETAARLLSFAVLASWVVEFTEVPVCIALVGPPSPGRRQLLRLLHCLFRRALRLGEASLAGLSSLPVEIGPTLLIERCEPTPQFFKFLEATGSRDAQIVSKGRILNVCCSKVLCSEGSLSGTVPDWSGLEILTSPSAGSVPVFDFRAQEQIVSEFQPKLEMFRLENYALVRDSSFDLPETTNAAREMVRCLGASVAGDVVLQAQLAALLTEHYSPMHIQSEKELHSAVIEALLALSHQAGKESGGVAEITTAVNAILERRGESLEMNPRAVGSLLRVLGLSTRRLGASGRCITLLNSVRRRIHELADKHKIIGETTASKMCAQCDEMYRKKVDDEMDGEKEIIQKLGSLTDEQLEHPFRHEPGGPVILSRNENAYGPSQKVIASMQDSLQFANRHPDPATNALHEIIAKSHSIKPEQLALGCGSGESSALPQPLFSVPATSSSPPCPPLNSSGSCEGNGSRSRQVPLGKDSSDDLGAMFSRTDAATTLIYICNPNNPTGALNPRKDLEAFIQKLPATTTVLIDEAYHHFV